MLTVLAGSLFTLTFITAVWGRIWCGWACPQTVFSEGVFRRIERWIEGDSVERKRLDEAPFTATKLWKKTLKWSLFLLATLVITHSFIAYFVGPDELRQMMGRSPSESPQAFIFMAALTGLMLFDLGWFREQFCIIACPYGRFQSVLLDARSQVVSYDIKRGEPRKGLAAPGATIGDCVNCYRCVQVCPTGIDIRRGVQLECVACTACMDACDDVMSRLHKPKGLIRYDTLIPGKAPKALRFRPMMYLFIVMVCATSLFLILQNRRALEADVVRAAEAPYQQITAPDGSLQLVNHFKFDLKNQSFDDQTLAIVVPEALQARGVQIVVSNFNASLTAGSSERSDVFVKFPKALLNYGHALIQLTVTSNRPGSNLPVEVKLVGPFN